MNSIRRAVLQGSIGSFAIKLANAVLGFVISIILARALGADDFGSYSYAFAFATLLIVPAQFGLPDLLMREIARFHVNEQWPWFKGIYSRFNLIVGVFAAIWIVVALLLILIPGGSSHAANTLTMLLSLTLIPLFAFGGLRNAALKGMGFVVRGLVPEFIVRPLVFIFLLLAAIGLTSSNIGSELAMLAHAIAAFVGVMVGALMLSQAWPTEARIGPSAYDTATWLRTAVPIGIADGMNVVHATIGLLIVGYMSTAVDVAHLRIAIQLSALVVFAHVAVNRVVAPQAARLSAANRLDELEDIAVWGAQRVSVIALAALVCLTLIGKPMLIVFFGSDFAPAYAALIILSVGQTINAISGPAADILVMSGFAADVALAKCLATIAAIALTIALIPQFGVEGAAFANATTLAAWKCYLVYRVRCRLGITCTAISLKRNQPINPK